MRKKIPWYLPVNQNIGLEAMSSSLNFLNLKLSLMLQPVFFTSSLEARLRIRSEVNRIRSQGPHFKSIAYLSAGEFNPVFVPVIFSHSRGCSNSQLAKSTIRGYLR